MQVSNSSWKITLDYEISWNSHLWLFRLILSPEAVSFCKSLEIAWAEFWAELLLWLVWNKQGHLMWENWRSRGNFHVESTDEVKFCLWAILGFQNGKLEFKNYWIPKIPKLESKNCWKVFLNQYLNCAWKMTLDLQFSHTNSAYLLQTSQDKNSPQNSAQGISIDLKKYRCWRLVETK